MKSFFFLCAVGTAIFFTVLGQDTSITASLNPAATIVVTTTSSAAPVLFSSESVQLTDDVLQDIADTLQHDTLTALFSFNATNLTSSEAYKWLRSGSDCKLLPGDSAWPSDLIWTIFNILLGGMLIKTVPSAAPCYQSWPEYNAAECTKITAEWYNSEFHMDNPTSIMLPLYEGRTCLPPSLANVNTCTIGGYPSYAVNVSNVAQIQLAVNFARNANLRFVVKNTGHDFNGKASGAGALSVWTHWLKDKTYLPSFEADNGYVGPAIKVGAGLQVFEVYEYAKSLGVTALGGEGMTVGMAGGWTAGGGHSPLSNLYGLGADQVLALEVVLADGSFVTATSKVNSDIFWMLRGGGGSTIGVVTSLIVKVFPILFATTAQFNFTVSPTISNETFWKGVAAYFDNFERFVDNGAYGYYYLGSSPVMFGTDGYDDYYFRLTSFFAPNMTILQIQALLAPWLATMTKLGIHIEPYYQFAENFYDAWQPAFPQEFVGTDTAKTASRLMPRSVFQSNSQATFLAHQTAILNGYFAVGFHITGTGLAVDPPTDNAVLPAWRETLNHAIIGTLWDANATAAEIRSISLGLTAFMDLFRSIAPDAGCYMSEADIIEPNLQEAFYGTNYPRLYSLKQKYDPLGLFFALTAVGAEDWEVQTVDELWNNNGRLCRIN